MEDQIQDKEAKAPNLLERAKEEIEAIVQTNKDHHHHHHQHQETHGLIDDIDENTPIDEVKAPNVFERAKEEIEALVETIHPKKESKQGEKKREGGFWSSLGRMFEKFCSPVNAKRD